MLLLLASQNAEYNQVELTWRFFGMKKTCFYWISVALLTMSLLLTDCARNPVSGKRELALISESQEIALGQEAHPEILKQFGTVENEAMQRYVNDIGQRIAAISHRPSLPWHFTVVDDPVVNAFALPGGFIYFTRGILAHMNSEAELAGVLGHEIGHVTARHSVSQISKSQLFGLGLGLGSVISPTFGQLSQLAQTGLGLLFLKYGRDDERESDQLGVEYMYKVGYDPRELSDFFEVFQRMREDEGSAVPDWLSTHPSPPDRIEATRAKADALVAEDGAKNLKVGREEFLQKIAGIVYGENPREGFYQEGDFYHPDLKFRLEYPRGWKVLNSRAVVLFAEPSRKALAQLTLLPPDVPSPEARAEQISSQQGVRVLEGGSRTINGNPAFLGIYQLTDDLGNGYRVLAGFIRFQQNIYQLVGYGSLSNFQDFYGDLERLITSFRELRDEGILKVQPDRIRLYQVQRGGTLVDIAERYPNPRVDVRELSVLNRFGESEPLKAGTLVKVVEAGR